jgi:hypothetical protein
MEATKRGNRRAASEPPFSAPREKFFCPLALEDPLCHDSSEGPDGEKNMYQMFVEVRPLIPQKYTSAWMTQDQPNLP